MKKSGFLVLLGMFTIILSLYVNAIGLSPDMTYLKFEPFAEGKISVYVINTENNPINAFVALDGDMLDYFEVNSESKLIPEGKSDEFVISYKMPYEAEKPGPNQIIIRARKSTGPGGGGLSAVAAVISKIIVDVPYPGKYIAYSFSGGSVNIDENLVFDFNLESKGKDNIFTVKPFVRIYDIDNLEEYRIEFMGNPVSLATGSTKSSTIVLNSSVIGVGDYFVEHFILYDGTETEHKNLTLAVGYKDVKITNYTDVLIAGGIRKFSVSLRNMWNSLVKDVYVEAYVAKDGVPLSTRSVSYTVDMVPLKTIDVPIFLDISEIKTGDYEVVLDIFYAELEKQEKIDITIKKGFEMNTGMILLLILAVLVVTDIGWMIFERRGKKGQAKPPSNSEEKFNKLEKKIEDSYE
tara:strand:+ start:5342 stop:6562 length:1221 start_codon:yes stop_codon:yes gene_type:complete